MILHAFVHEGIIPVLVDPQATCLDILHPQVMVDARMLSARRNWLIRQNGSPIGLGPGFVAGDNCDAAVETKRGHFLGRVYWHGSPEPDTGKPEPVENREGERVIRAPGNGKLETYVEIGDIVLQGAPLAK